MTIIPGTLTIKTNTGLLKRDTELFGKMSPFVQYELGAQKRRVGKHAKGGKNPNWKGEVLKFEVVNEDSMKVTVWDEEKVKSNDLIGETVVYLAGITKGEIKQQPIEIIYKNKMVGTIYVEYEFQTRMSQQVGSSLMKGLGLGAMPAQAAGQPPIFSQQSLHNTANSMTRAANNAFGFQNPHQPVQPQLQMVYQQPQPNTMMYQQPAMTMQAQPAMSLQQQPTMGLQPQQTMGLQQQPTMGLQQQPTMGIQPQQTMGLQPQQTMGLQPQQTMPYQQPASQMQMGYAQQPQQLQTQGTMNPTQMQQQPQMMMPTQQQPQQQFGQPIMQQPQQFSQQQPPMMQQPGFNYGYQP